MSKRAYWLLENLLLNTFYEDKRASNIDAKFEFIEFTKSISGPDPQNYKVAMNFLNTGKWKEVYNTEINSNC